jgi:RNA polymerase sigma-70 factor (ECF subfamily)
MDPTAPNARPGSQPGSQPDLPPDAPVAALFAALLATTQDALRGFIHGMVGSVEQAQDITQDVFVDAWRAAARGRAPFDGSGDEAGMRRWLFHVAYQRAVSALRHGRVLRIESLDVPLPPEPSRLHEPPPFEERVAEGEALQAVLNALDPPDAACLLLSVVQGFTAAEVAAILQITPAAAKKRLTRAKQRLRAAYFARHTHKATGRTGWEVPR